MMYTTTLDGKILYEHTDDGVIVRTKRMVTTNPTGNKEVFERMFMDKDIIENLIKELPKELSRIGEKNERS